MGLLDLASGASAWRGYEYYKDGSVLLKKKITDNEYSGTLRGSENKHYRHRTSEKIPLQLSSCQWQTNYLQASGCTVFFCFSGRGGSVL